MVMPDARPTSGAPPDVRDHGRASTNDHKGVRMPLVTVGRENSADITIHYRDHGLGRPIVLVHGYPLDGNSWERQERVLLANGYRCISYYRRGFGRVGQTTTGYYFHTFAADLKSLLDHLGLDQDVV